MSDKLECPHCKVVSEKESYNFSYHRLGRIGDCSQCNKKVFLTTPARGILKDKNGVARKRFKNA